MKRKTKSYGNRRPETTATQNLPGKETGPRRRRQGKRQPEARIEIPTGEPDLSALLSAMKEWLVPNLVEDFLRERGIELKYSRVHTSVLKNPTFKI